MNVNTDPLLGALRAPELMVSFSITQWNDVLRRARVGRVVARLGVLAQEHGILDQIPEKVRDHFIAAKAGAAQHERVARWEVNRIERALWDVDTELVLLKGAAYVMAGLPPARGRLVSDVDIMVPKHRIAAVEQALLDHGWCHMKLDAYDQRYYRTWMHELPPLQHSQRESVVDVHHTILPESGRLHPAPDLLLADAVALPGDTRAKVLGPVDMLLHSAVHLFQDGDFEGGLRDLLDMDDLLRHFGKTQPGFWDRLVPRAVQLDLARPLFYALRFTRQLLGTPIPQPVIDQALAYRPDWPIADVMDRLIRRALLMDRTRRLSWATDIARWLLYVRSHWLRMPPLLLAGHLFRKGMNTVLPSPDDPLR